MDNKLTILQAFKAMYAFLESYYNQTKSDDLGLLLSCLQLFPEGGTFDPAMWQEWLDAIGPKDDLTTLEAFKGVQRFLEYYCSYVDSEDIMKLLNSMQASYKDLTNSIIWQKWELVVNQTMNN